MHARCIVTVLTLSAAILAQSPRGPCPADRPVDEIIAETQKQQSNRANRNKNPLPEEICVWGWCRDTTKERTPPTVPQTHPNPEARPVSNGSSSKDVTDSCELALDRSLQAAHDIEVGDISYREDNYRGALMRYELAAENKPNDAAIHVRLGRVRERLHEIPEAIKQYEMATKLKAPEKWSNEALTALQRLRRSQPQ